MRPEAKQLIEQVVAEFSKGAGKNQEQDFELIMILANIFTNAVASIGVAQVVECSCPTCRKNVQWLAEEHMDHVRSMLKTTIDSNLQINGMEPIFHTNHNRQVFDEVLAELEADKK